MFGEEDAMIGKKGRKYFEDCECRRGIETRYVEVKGRDHDSVVEPSKGAVGSCFRLRSAGLLREEFGMFVRVYIIWREQ